MSRPRLFLIDSFGFIFRAYHARARSGAPPMRTASGLSTEAVYIFHNMIRKLMTSYKPEFVAAVFESSGPTFRDEAFAEYKANREAMPPDLSEQIPYIRRLLEAMRIPILEYEGFEADDVIGTIARRSSSPAMDVVIVSSDKDMLQLVDDRVSMYNPMKEDVWYDPAKTEEFMGVKPTQVADLLALKGDAIDNIPGAPGIGDKGARDLIAQFGSVEAALDRAAEVQRKMYRESLQNNRDRILLSKQLATIATNVPVEFQLDSVKTAAPDPNALKPVYKELEFFSLLKELGPSDDAHARDYAVIDDAAALDEWIAAVPAGATVAVAASRGQDLTPAMVGFAARVNEGRCATIDVVAASAGARQMLASDRAKLAHDVKSTVALLEELGLPAAGFRHDLMLYAFLLSADPSGCSPETLSEKFLDRKHSKDPDQAAESALAVYEKIAPEIDKQGLRELYETIDLPLTGVLARMERNGILIDPEALKALSVRMDQDIQRLTGEICTLAGKQFNINSPQQLGKVLFEDMGLPVPMKYGKGKQISTAAEVLEELADEHEIARKVLDYRQLAKLKGTYVDALPALIDPRSGRVHTTFNPIGAATGRLSSSNPNLQNIPVRTELGREIRAAFIPRPGWTLVTADYSQIELRLLAHMSRDKVLVDAFRRGEDIHTRTAAEVFGAPPIMVTADQRRNAKAVNFGIVYGQTPFGLAQQLGIDRKEAEAYIKAYFERYSGVRKFIDATIAQVRQSGVATTLLGRKRPIPDMHSRNPNARSFAERTAVNTPLQGTAADLIKIAMIRVDRELAERKYESRMLLQVHDELVFEAPAAEVADLREMVKSTMERVYPLEVPLVADVGAGANWRDAK
ncbi:MAG: DNA polymerase I [Acidobacteria bacterium]|nr:DNA polymerase I [Acidobacteriota bacterium]